MSGSSPGRLPPLLSVPAKPTQGRTSVRGTVLAAVALALVVAVVGWVWFGNAATTVARDLPVVAGVQTDTDGLKVIDAYVVAGPIVGASAVRRADLVAGLTVVRGDDDLLREVRLPSPARPQAVDMAVGGSLVSLGPQPGARPVTVVGTGVLRPGTFVNVTLVFARRGAVVLDVPVWDRPVPVDAWGTPG